MMRAGWKRARPAPHRGERGAGGTRSALTEHRLEIGGARREFRVARVALRNAEGSPTAPDWPLDRTAASGRGQAAARACPARAAAANRRDPAPRDRTRSRETTSPAATPKVHSKTSCAARSTSPPASTGSFSLVSTSSIRCPTTRAWHGARSPNPHPRGAGRLLRGNTRDGCLPPPRRQPLRPCCSPVSASRPRIRAWRPAAPVRHTQIVVLEGRNLGFTVSMGVASFPAHGAQPEALKETADRAGRARKRGGNHDARQHPSASEGRDRATGGLSRQTLVDHARRRPGRTAHEREYALELTDVQAVRRVRPAERGDVRHRDAEQRRQVQVAERAGQGIGKPAADHITHGAGQRNQEARRGAGGHALWMGNYHVMKGTGHEAPPATSRRESRYRRQRRASPTSRAWRAELEACGLSGICVAETDEQNSTANSRARRSARTPRRTGNQRGDHDARCDAPHQVPAHRAALVVRARAGDRGEQDGRHRGWRWPSSPRGREATPH